MSQPLILATYLVLALLAANLPFLTERRLFVLPTPEGAKGWGFRLVEWLLMYALALAAGYLLERRLTGDVHAQDWEFYVVTMCLFMVLALPGVIGGTRRRGRRS